MLGDRLSRRAAASDDAVQVTATRQSAAITLTAPGHCGPDDVPLRRRAAAAGETSEASATFGGTRAAQSVNPCHMQ
jgi:hypothetical protein